LRAMRAAVRAASWPSGRARTFTFSLLFTVLASL
jgi:hypothetical protein